MAGVGWQHATIGRIEATAAATLRRCERTREAVLAGAFLGQLV